MTERFSNPYDDPRVRRGLQRQLAARRRSHEDGARPLGWKAGMGSGAAMQAIRTSGPLVGYLNHDSLLPSGAEVSIAGWTTPLVEIEVAVRLGTDLPGGRDATSVGAAIAALAPAIELVDLDAPHGPDDVEDFLADGFFHRHVVLGSFDPAYAGGATGGVRLDVDGHGRSYARDADPAAVVGEVVDVVRVIADQLDAAGERLRAGDVVLTGAAIPPFAAEPGERVVARFAGLGSVEVAFSGVRRAPVELGITPTA